MENLHRHRDSQVLAKGLLVNFLGTVIRTAKGLSFIIITRFFGAAVFGMYSLCWSFVELISKFGYVGFERTSIRYIAKGDWRVFWYCLKATVVISLLVSVAATFLAPWIATTFLKSAEASVPLRWLIWSVPLLALSIVILGALAGLKIMKYMVWVRSIIEPVVFFVGVLFFYFLGWRLGGIIFAHILAIASGTGASFLFLRRHQILVKKPLEPAEVREVWRFSIPLPFYDAFNFLLTKKDLFLLGLFLDPASVGLFAVANEIAMSANKIRQGFEPIVGPMAAELHHLQDRRRMKDNYRMAVRWSLSLYLLFVAGMWFLGEPVLSLFGREFIPAFQTLFLLTLAYSIHGVFVPAEISLEMGGKSWLNMFNTLGHLVINVGLNLWLIPKYGIVGAALGTCFCSIAADLVRTIEVYVLFKKHPFEWATVKLFVSIAVAMITVLLFNHWWQEFFVVDLLVLCVCFMVMIYILGMEAEEKELVRSMMATIRGVL